jgi:hypothetical protein
MDAEQVLVHQVHAGKLAADISAAAVSNVLLWRGRTRAGLAVRYLLPVAASAVILPRDLSGLRDTRRGRYVVAHMPPPAQAVRLLGDTVMAVGAARRRLPLVVLGLGVVVAGWSGIAIPRPGTRSSCRRSPGCG